MCITPVKNQLLGIRNGSITFLQLFTIYYYLLLFHFGSRLQSNTPETPSYVVTG